MKYQLLLRDVLKYTEKAQLAAEVVELKKAVQIMHVVPKTANDMMKVSRLQNFDGKIPAQGKLLQQGPLMVADVMTTPGVPVSSSAIKMKERQVFLFEQIIIFSEVVGQKTQFSNPNYLYKNHLQVNKMSLVDETAQSSGGGACAAASGNDPSSTAPRFTLKSKDPNQEGQLFICQGLTPEETVEWMANIRAILDTQLDFLRALQSPIAYQKELTKEM